MVAPRLVASTQSSGSESSLAPEVAAGHMTRIVHDSPPTPTTIASETAPTTVAPAPPTTAAPSTTSAPRVVEGVDDGSVVLAASFSPPGAGKEGEVIRDGDVISWTFTVTAQTEELWGVFVFLEGHGHVPCETKHLEVGESTTCEATERVYLDDTGAEVWVDAWTLDRMVTDTVHPIFTVAP